MDLRQIVTRYQSKLLNTYGDKISSVQRRALGAIEDCQSARYGEMLTQCHDCHHPGHFYNSCGHRSCSRCQNHQTTNWLERQRRKLLPVPYFMVTFTVPYELRTFSQRHQKIVYDALFSCGKDTLMEFGLNEDKLGGDMGMTGVLHTHTRKLDYHPHIHIIVPGCCLMLKRKQYKKLKGEYLFNEFSLAKVFRAKMLAALREHPLEIPTNLPEKWVAHCKHVGHGEPALKYLSRYLYRGVISDRNLLKDDGENITFGYVESGTDTYKTRTLKGEDFLWLLLKHVLPRGFRRVRNYGFLHGNAKKRLAVVQWILQVFIVPRPATPRPAFRCPACSGEMKIVAFIAPGWRTG